VAGSGVLQFPSSVTIPSIQARRIHKPFHSTDETVSGLLNTRDLPNTLTESGRVAERSSQPKCPGGGEQSEVSDSPEGSAEWLPQDPNARPRR